MWLLVLHVTASEILSSLWKVLFLSKDFVYKVRMGMHHSFQAWADI